MLALVVDIFAAEARGDLAGLLGGRVVVAGGDHVAPHLDFALGEVGGGHDLAVVNHAVLQGGSEAALGDAVGPAGLAGGSGRRPGDGTDGGSLRHTPHVHHVHAVALLPHLDQGGRRRRAADENLLQAHALGRVVQVVHHQLDPQGGHPVGDARVGARDELGQGGRGHVRIRQHQRRASQKRGERHAPAQHVVDGDAAQKRLTVGHGQRVGGAQARRLQPQGAVRIGHALRCAGGGGGVHQRGCGVFRQFGPRVGRRSAVEKLLVAVYLDCVGEVRSCVVKRFDARKRHRAHGRAVLQNFAQLLCQPRVRDHDFGLGVVDNVRNLIRHELHV